MSVNKDDIKKELSDNPLLDILGAEKPPVVFTKYRRLHSYNHLGELESLQKFKKDFEALREPVPKKVHKHVKSEEIGIDVLHVHSSNSNESVKVKGNP